MYLHLAPKKLYILLCFLVACSTKEAPKKKMSHPEIKTVVVKKSKKQKKKRYINDTITTENCVFFFKQYGKDNQETKVLLTTRLGSITIRLYKNTPLHRASFIYLVKARIF